MCVSSIRAYWRGCHSLIWSLHATAQAFKLPPSHPWEQVQSLAGLSSAQQMTLFTSNIGSPVPTGAFRLPWLGGPWVRVDPLSVHRTYPHRTIPRSPMSGALSFYLCRTWCVATHQLGICETRLLLPAVVQSNMAFEGWLPLRWMLSKGWHCDVLTAASRRHNT